MGIAIKRKKAEKTNRHVIQFRQTTVLMSFFFLTHRKFSNNCMDSSTTGIPNRISYLPDLLLLLSVRRTTVV